MKYRNPVLYLALVLASPLPAFGTGSELSDSCVSAISRIKSYDAQITVGIVTYPQSNASGKKENSPQVEFTMTNRDVFAVGFGRRVEMYVGMESEHNVGVIDWKTALHLEEKDPKSKPFLIARPGFTYHDYYNPEAGVNGTETGLFLADLLRDKEADIEPLQNAPAGGPFHGFELNHPGLNGPIRIWVDPAHGQMPARIEWFARRGKQDLLTTALEVKKFIEVENGTWVPGTATLTSFMPLGPTQGQPILGYSMEVDTERSRWNCIGSDELFTAQSLPAMNHQERGWSFHYPPKMLSAIEASAKFDNQMLKKLGHRSSLIRFGAGLLLLSPLIWAASKGILSRRKSMQHKPT